MVYVSITINYNIESFRVFAMRVRQELRSYWVIGSILVVKPELNVTVALGRVKLSVSDTVIASVTARARPFSVYASAAVSRPDSTGFCCAAATATSIAIIVCHIVIRIVPAREVGSSRSLDR